ncbi:MlaC/ttg2D family ABC transporter substrate-binding protein [Halotalea alkalilenta]|uniref:Toluene tolerance protein n=1 Tax=Halotalea alkalilenta TaxID=376489 RepID=A0A172YE38_9GAMM|nr:ABC transporter substrate-binding protein [Halotalea alkalilenta]ANF57518.1 toluene tolerance protein [Halotalea alkalilenta]
MKAIVKYCALLTMGMAIAFASVARADQPADIVTRSINQLQQETQGRSAEFQQNPNELRTLLERQLLPIADFPYISAMVMGRYYQAASTEQRQRFASTFQESTLDTLTRGLLTFDYEELEVSSAQQAQRYDDQANVSLEVRGTDGKRYPVSFTMRERNGDWKVINVIVNGINLGLTFRNQFDQAMREHNRDFDAVIQAWDPSAAVEEIQSSDGSDDANG